MENSSQKTNITIEAQVFRMGTKPKFIPARVWVWMAKKRIPGTGRWDNLGMIASTQQGNVQIT